MKRKRSRLALVGVLALALTVTVGVSVDTAAAAKKKSKKSKVFNSAGPTVAIPDAAPGPAFTFGITTTNFNVGKKFKGREVADVTVTIQTTGSGNGAANQTAARLTDPKGRTVALYGSGLGGAGAGGIPSIGPMTLSSNSPVLFCDSPTPPCADPTATFTRPFIGTGQNNALALFEGRRMKGTWKVTWFDVTNGLTSTAKATLRIVPEAPDA
jgi:hypothetical protein